MSRVILLTLIVLSLALVSLALVQAQARPAEDAVTHAGTDNSCVTICPLPGEGHPTVAATVTPAAVPVEPGAFLSLLPRTELPARAQLADRYLPIILHGVDPSRFLDLN